MSTTANIYNDFILINGNDATSYDVTIECPLATWDEVHVLPIIANLAGAADLWYATCSLVNDQVIGVFRSDMSNPPNHPMVFKNTRQLGSFRGSYRVTFFKADGTAIGANNLTGEIVLFFRFIKYRPTYEAEAEEKQAFHRHV